CGANALDPGPRELRLAPPPMFRRRPQPLRDGLSQSVYQRVEHVRSLGIPRTIAGPLRFMCSEAYESAGGDIMLTLALVALLAQPVCPGKSRWSIKTQLPNAKVATKLTVKQ